MFRFLMIFFILARTICIGETYDLSLTQQAVLKVFVETLLEHSESGYAVLNKKPVCVEGYFSKDPLPVNSTTHRQSTALRAGAGIWKDLVDSPSDVIIHICNREDPRIPGYIHVLVINIPLFHQVVNESLPLFQYVLGPAVTSQALLDALLSNRQTFYSLLKGDKVLIGKLLGYGEQNSLYIARKENIQEAMDEDVPPFQSASLIRQDYNEEFLPFSPSFSFKSIGDEINTLQSQTTTSSTKLITQTPQFVFGWVKSSDNSRKIISELENTQDLINKSLLSSLSLEEILQKFGKKNHTFRKNNSDSFITQHDINEVMAKAVWEAIQTYDSDYLPYFFEGLKATESQGSGDRLARFPAYRRTFLEAKANLQEADELFERLKLDSNYRTVIPAKLSYRMIKSGNGDVKCKGCHVSLSYSIFSPMGHCLATEANVVINLKNTIPGLALGVKGMQLGETREILIHPTLAYGFETSLDKCIYLRAIVGLIDIKNNSEFDLKINQLDLGYVKSNDYLKKIEDNYRKAIVERAVDIARYLRKCDKLNLSLIENHLRSYHVTGVVKSPLTYDEQDLVNQIHWKIYFNPEQSAATNV